MCYYYGVVVTSADSSPIVTSVVPVSERFSLWEKLVSVFRKLYWANAKCNLKKSCPEARDRICCLIDHIRTANSRKWLAIISITRYRDIDRGFVDLAISRRPEIGRYHARPHACTDQIHGNSYTNAHMAWTHMAGVQRTMQFQDIVEFWCSFRCWQAGVWCLCLCTCLEWTPKFMIAKLGLKN